jgi:hypothetical protein
LAPRSWGDSTFDGDGVMSENWHKRQAVGIACQLPDNADDARAILREVQNLVDTWLHPLETEKPSKVFTLLRDKE